MISEENSPKEYCTWDEIDKLTVHLSKKIYDSRKKYDFILAITNGGIVPARLIAKELDIQNIQFVPIRNKKLYVEELVPLHQNKKYLIVDDIYDTGDTFFKVFDVVKEFNFDFAFLMTRYQNNNAKLVAKILNHRKWIVFPWEKKFQNNV
jgi:hypoxanthine phosphoribosyltransferase